MPFLVVSIFVYVLRLTTVRFFPVLISIIRLSFKSIRNGQEYTNKLKGLPKIQRSIRDTYTCARKIFVNGVMESNRFMSNTMKTRYHRAFTLQEEADEQEWTRYLLRNSTEIREI